MSLLNNNINNNINNNDINNNDINNNDINNNDNNNNNNNKNNNNNNNNNGVAATESAVIGTKPRLDGESGSFNLMGLPTEIRCDIYEIVFHDPLYKAPNTFLLNEKVAFSSNLRCASKFIENESYQIYKSAIKTYDARRKEIQHEIAEFWYAEERDKGVPHEHLFRAQDLLFGSHKCEHACATDPDGPCYMCDDLAHRRCFNCGRNMTLALSHRTFPLKTPPPHLVIPHTNGPALTPQGKFLVYGVPHHTMRPTLMEYFPWAYTHWQVMLKHAQCIEARCQMREKAVAAFWRGDGGGGGGGGGGGSGETGGDLANFTEWAISRLEKNDKRWGMIFKLLRTCCQQQKEYLGWKQVFRERMVVKAREAGRGVEYFVPRLD